MNTNKQQKQKILEEIIQIGSLENYIIGYQISAEFYGVKNISYIHELAPIMENSLKQGNFHIPKGKKPEYHQFNPYGVSGIVLLEESHIAFHSWPEHDYISIDIFSCNGKYNAEIAYNVFKEKLKPKKIKKTVIIKSIQDL